MQSPQATNIANSQTVTVIKIDGSSTLDPIAQAITKDFLAITKNNTQVQVKISATGGGFEKFCAGEIDINKFSYFFRPI